jgi:hypothetical protein
MGGDRIMDKDILAVCGGRCAVHTVYGAEHYLAACVVSTLTSYHELHFYTIVRYDVNHAGSLRNVRYEYSTTVVMRPGGDSK